MDPGQGLQHRKEGRFWIHILFVDVRDLGRERLRRSSRPQEDVAGAGPLLPPGQTVLSQKFHSDHQVEPDVGIWRNILDHTRDFEISTVFGQMKHLADRILRAEILEGGLLGDDDGVPVLKGGLRVAFYKREGKHPEESGICHVDPVLLETFFSMFNERAVPEPDPGELLNFRIQRFQGRGQRIRGRGDQVPAFCFVQNPEDPVFFLVETVKTQFILHPQPDQDKTGHPDCKTYDIDKRISFMTFELPKSHFQIVSEHCHSPCRCFLKAQSNKSSFF